MSKPFTSIVLFALVLALPTAARAQIDSPAVIEGTSAIFDAAQAAEQIRHLRQVPSVGVLYIEGGGVFTSSHIGEQLSSMEILAERNAANINILRHALRANPVTARTMAEHHVNVNHVIGVSIGATGSLRFFIE